MTAVGSWPRSRLRVADLLGVAAQTLSSRPAGTVLTAVGIAIGVAALVAVVGISSSSRAVLLAELDRLGTDVLVVHPGSSVRGEPAVLPAEATAMLRRIGPVTAATAVVAVDAPVRRSELVPELETGGVRVLAAPADLAATLDVTVRSGRALTPADEGLPVAVLGADAARLLALEELRGGRAVVIGGHRFAVVGVLEPVGLAPTLDRAAIIGPAVAELLFDIDRHPSAVYLRAPVERIADVTGVVPRTANPAAPHEVTVTRPSTALAARAAVDRALTALLLGLGGVALLVGGVGVANATLGSVVQRRAEIGLRRALGATRAHIRRQVVVESALLALLGGAGGVAVGAAVTAAVAASRGWPVAVPLAALAGGVGLSLVVGVLAALHPAARAARLQPADAVRE